MIADFRRDCGAAIRNVCRRSVELCRGLKLLSSDMVAIDGSKFKSSNSHDRNYTASKINRRQQQIEESVQRYLDLIETADRTSPTGFDVKSIRLYEKITRLRQQLLELAQVRGEKAGNCRAGASHLIWSHSCFIQPPAYKCYEEPASRGQSVHGPLHSRRHTR